MSDELVARFESSPSNGNVIVDARDIRIAALERELAEVSNGFISQTATILRLERELAEAQAALAALREQHAEAVEQAFREGAAHGLGFASDRHSIIVAAWLASEAKARLDNGSL